MKNIRIALAAVSAATQGLLSATAQAQVPQYGSNVNHEQARKVVAGAIAEARKQNLPMAVAVVDTVGVDALGAK
jgi:hypothetical protein